MEREMGLRFPEHYKRKLFRENGGELATSTDEWQLFPVFDQTDRKRISRTCNNIATETKKQRNWPRFPSEAVAIGSNGYGDILILLPESPASKVLSDTIYWWNHETGNVSKLANSIEEMLSIQADGEDWRPV
jgi:hypothetical protein